MNEFDEFSENLLEESKRFLEKAKQSDGKIQKNAFLHASLLLGFSALEAYINSICDELLLQPVPLMEESILSEKGIILEDGQFRISKSLKMFRIVDRIQFLNQKFSGKSIKDECKYWSDLCSGIKLRNEISHPKDISPEITEKKVANALMAIIGTINQLCLAIYKKKFPKFGKDLNSSLDF